MTCSRTSYGKNSGKHKQSKPSHKLQLIDIKTIIILQDYKLQLNQTNISPLFSGNYKKGKL
jgi:hypothetical protein